MAERGGRRLVADKAERVFGDEEREKIALRKGLRRQRKAGFLVEIAPPLWAVVDRRAEAVAQRAQVAEDCPPRHPQSSAVFNCGAQSIAVRICAGLHRPVDVLQPLNSAKVHASLRPGLLSVSTHRDQRSRNGATRNVTAADRPHIFCLSLFWTAVVFGVEVVERDRLIPYNLQ